MKYPSVIKKNRVEPLLDEDDCDEIEKALHTNIKKGLRNKIVIDKK
jgi:hypothetical protein